MKETLKELIDAFPAVDRATAAACEAFKTAKQRRQELADAIYKTAKRGNRWAHYKAADGSVVIVGRRLIGNSELPSVYIADPVAPS